MIDAQRVAQIRHLEPFAVAHDLFQACETGHPNGGI